MADASAVPSSPFLELERPFTSYEAFKLVLLLPLMIVKLIIGVGTLCLIALLNSLAAMGNADDQPLSPARRQVILFTSRYLLPVVHVCIGFRVRGKRGICLHRLLQQLPSQHAATCPCRATGSPPLPPSERRLKSNFCCALRLCMHA